MVGERWSLAWFRSCRLEQRFNLMTASADCSEDDGALSEIFVTMACFVVGFIIFEAIKRLAFMPARVSRGAPVASQQARSVQRSTDLVAPCRDLQPSFHQLPLRKS